MSLMLALLLAVPQNTWVVDANNGPGTNFTDVPPAVAAAAHGDTILVRARPGVSYAGFQVVGKALTIRAIAGTSSFGSASPRSTIGQVPAGSLFFVEGFSIPALSVVNGNVAFTNDTIRDFAAASATILAARCEFHGGEDPATLTSSPGVTLTQGCVFVADRSQVQGGIGPNSTNCILTCHGDVGIRATDSSLQLTNTSVGGGWSHNQLPNCFVTYVWGHHGISLTHSTAWIAGDNTNWIAAGLSSIVNGPPYAISADSASSATVYGPVNLQGLPGYPAVNGPVVLTTADLPQLRLAGVPLDSDIATTGPVTVTVINSGLPNMACILGFTTTVPAPMDLSPFAIGGVMLPLSAFNLLTTLDSAGSFQVTFPGVLVPWLSVPVFGQAAVFDATANQVRMSNLEMRVFRP